MKNKILMLIAALALIVGLRGATIAATDSWSAQAEETIAFSQAITLNTVALVHTAVTSRVLNVRGGVITNSASGVVRLYSTSTNSVGANLIGAFAVIANTPLVLSEDQLGVGVTTRSGEALYVDAATGTVSMTLRVRKDLKGPSH